MTMHERDRDDAGAGTAGTGGTTDDFRERAMPPDLAGDHAATGEGTAPVAHGAAGPPLQQHQDSTEMIYGRQEGGGADEREGRLPRRSTRTRPAHRSARARAARPVRGPAARSRSCRRARRRSAPVTPSVATPAKAAMT